MPCDPTEAPRTLVLSVPDWSAVAAAAEHDLGEHVPVVILHAGAVIAASASARAAGVAIGINKRAAGLRCPEAQVLTWDEDVDQRQFAAGVSVLEDLVARFTLLTPGTLALPLDALKHEHADETGAVQTLISSLVAATGWEFFPGIADTIFAARLAARTAVRVEPGRTREFLAGQPIDSLEIAGTEYAELSGVLDRLGLDTLGLFAQLPRQDVISRFGELGGRAHDLALGLPEPLAPEHIRQERFSVLLPLETPSTRSDTLAFLTRGLATELMEAVRRIGLICTQVTIELTAAQGASSTRTWRIENMDAGGIVDRLRWQAEGWLAGLGARSGPATGTTVNPEDEEPADPGPDPEDMSEDGIILIGLSAAELVTALGASTSLFDENTGLISRTLERVQGLFGPDTVLVPGLQGGWDPEETNLWTPWQQSPRPRRDPQAPWPGSLAAPRPITVEHLAVEVVDGSGVSVQVFPSGLTAVPQAVRFPDGSTEEIIDHSGAWPLESGWWEPETALYRTRLQVVTASGRALLLSKENGQWRLTGSYR